MAETIESVLSHELIHHPRKLLSEYQFELGGQTITIRLYEPIHGRRVEFTQSHYIHTPSQLGPYRTSSPEGHDEVSALRRAMSTLIPYYESAVEAGDQPDISWFVPNESF